MLVPIMQVELLLKNPLSILKLQCTVCLGGLSLHLAVFFHLQRMGLAQFCKVLCNTECFSFL